MSTTNTSPWPYVAFAGVALGCGGLAAKGLVDDGVDIFVLAGVPLAIGAVVAYIVAGLQGVLRRDAIPGGVALGVTVAAVPAILFNIGFDELSAGIVTLLVSLGPIATAIGAHFVFPDERFTRTKGAGLALAVAGVALLASDPGDGLGDNPVYGVSITLAGAVLAGLAMLLSRHYTQRHSPHALIAPQLLVGGIVPAILVVALDRPVAPEGGWELWHWLLMGAIGVFVSYGGFLAILRANEVGTTGQASVTWYIVPVVGVIGGVLVFDDDLTPGIVAGGALILLAVTLIGRGSQSAPGREVVSAV